MFLPLTDAARAPAAVYMGPLQHKIQERTTRFSADKTLQSSWCDLSPLHLRPQRLAYAPCPLCLTSFHLCSRSCLSDIKGISTFHLTALHDVRSLSALGKSIHAYASEQWIHCPVSLAL